VNSINRKDFENLQCITNQDDLQSNVPSQRPNDFEEPAQQFDFNDEPPQHEEKTGLANRKHTAPEFDFDMEFPGESGQGENSLSGQSIEIKLAVKERAVARSQSQTGSSGNPYSSKD
jgi:hypothetical protein